MRKRAPYGRSCLVLAGLFVATNASAQHESAAPKHTDESRMRGGIDVMGGIGSGGGISGPVVGATVRIGWQFDHLVGLYLRVAPFFWVYETRREILGDKATRTRGTASDGLGLQLGPMLSLTPGKVFEIAAGASLQGIIVMASSQPDSTASASQFPADTYERTNVSEVSRPAVGPHLRGAAHFLGKPVSSTGRRTSYTLGMDLDSSFRRTTVLMIATVSAGVEWY